MKRVETGLKHSVMVASFFYAGISVFLAIIFWVTYFSGGNVFLIGRFVGQAANGSPGVLLIIKYIAGLFALSATIGAILSFLSGILLLRSSHQGVKAHAEKEVEKVEKKAEKDVEEVKKEAKEKSENEVDPDVLVDDEKALIKVLQEHEGSMTQRELVQESGLSKVKVHRVLKKLESKKIVSKYDFGMTKRIRLEKKLKE